MNKNISIWRGAISPPTYTHIWLKPDGNLYEYRNGWVLMLPDASPETSGLMSKSDKQILDMLNKNLHWN